MQLFKTTDWEFNVYHFYQTRHHVLGVFVESVYGRSHRATFIGCKKSVAVLEGNAIFWCVL